MLQGRALSTALRQPLLRNILNETTSYRLAPRTLRNPQRVAEVRRNFNVNSSPLPSSLSKPIRWRTSLLRRNCTLRHNSTKAPESAAQERSKSGSLSISQRFRGLSRKYGWTAVGVYAGLSVLDFPFCFIAVRLIGTERIAEVEHAVTHVFWSTVGSINPNWKPEPKHAASVEGGSTSEAGEESHEDASIWTQLLLAYGVHKTLTPFRIPLAAVVTPKVAKILRGWGWQIGPRKAAANSIK